MNDDDDDMIVIIKLSLKQDTLPGLPIVSCDRAVLVNSTQRGGSQEEEDGEGKGRESVVHVVIYEKRRSFSAFPLRFWDPNDELNRLVPR